MLTDQDEDLAIADYSQKSSNSQKTIIRTPPKPNNNMAMGPPRNRPAVFNSSGQREDPMDVDTEQKSKVTCTYCKKSGHTWERCFKRRRELGATASVSSAVVSAASIEEQGKGQIQ